MLNIIYIYLYSDLYLIFRRTFCKHNPLKTDEISQNDFLPTNYQKKIYAYYVKN